MSRGPKSSRPSSRDNRRWTGILVKAIAVIAVLSFMPFFFSGDGTSNDLSTTFAAVRGDLKISVLEGGTLRALESQKVRSEVRGHPKILSIVDEGYRVTAEVVEKGLLLVELDRENLEREQVDDQLAYQADASNLSRVEMEIEIHTLERDSQMKQAQLRKKFDHMDFEKYMGVEASNEILDELDLERLILSGEASGSYSAGLDLPDSDLEEIEEVEEEDPSASEVPRLAGTYLGAQAGVEMSLDDSSGEVPEEPADLVVETVMSQIPEVDFQQYASPDKLGDGEASQKLLEFDDRVSMAKRKLKLDETELEGTRRLFARDFVNRNQLETEEMQVENSRLAAKAAETARDLFLRYEFPKEAEKRLADYEESLRHYVRKNKETISRLVGMETRLNWAKKDVARRRKELDEANRQLKKTVLVAKREGLVVYGGVDKHQWGGDHIKEGAAIRQWQTILTIPDMNTMTVLVKIHESDISSIEKGQTTYILIEGYPDRPLAGVVDKVSPLANSQDREMNPDLKVYDVTIRIDGFHDWLKPGKTAETEIQINALSDVLYIPIVAIQSEGAKRFCYVANGGRTPERRVVETGEFNDQFIIVTSGLKEGERVHLRPLSRENADTEEPDSEQDEEKAGPAAAKIQKPATPEGITSRSD